MMFFVGFNVNPVNPVKGGKCFFKKYVAFQST